MGTRISKKTATTKKSSTAGKEAKSGYAKAKEATRDAHMLLAAFKFAGEDGLSKHFTELTPDNRKTALRRAIGDAPDEPTLAALEALAAVEYPEGLGGRTAAALPDRVKATTTKQRKRPFVVVRLPDSFVPKKGNYVGVEETTHKGKPALILVPIG